MKPQLALHLFKDEEKKKPKSTGLKYMIFEKYDGWYGYIDFRRVGTEDTNKIMSRARRPIPSLREFSKRLHKKFLDSGLVDGRMIFEIRVKNYPEFKDLNGILNRSKGDCEATGAYIHVHDYIPCNQPEMPFIHRYTCATYMVDTLRLPDVHIAELLGVGDTTIMKHYFEQITKMRGEGVIGKNPESIYEPGKRNHNLLKIKEEVTLEMRVVGVAEGEGKYHGTLGTLVCVDSSGNRHHVSGMSDAERMIWWNDPQKIIGQVVQIKAMKVLENGSLREGRFDCIRYDKEEID